MTILISHDREFSGTNGLQIRIQLVKIHQKNTSPKFFPQCFRVAKFLGHFSQHYAPPFVEMLSGDQILKI
jgi:hypothetical protein